MTSFHLNYLEKRCPYVYILHIICYKCGDFIELVLSNFGEESSLTSQLEYFRVSEYDINTEVNSYNESDLVDKLFNESDEEIGENIENFIDEEISVDSNLEKVRFDCNKCGNYIVLTDFE